MRFGGLTAVDDLSLEVAGRQDHRIIGPNGAGKTTLFNCLTGFYKPSTGTLRLAHPRRRDAPVLGQPPRRTRRPVVRTFQNIRLFPKMTVLENLVVAQHNHLQRARSSPSPVSSSSPATARRSGRRDRTRGDVAEAPQAHPPRRRRRRRPALRHPAPASRSHAHLCVDPRCCAWTNRRRPQPARTAELNELLPDLCGDHGHRGPADRARHERGDGTSRPHPVISYGRKIAEGTPAQVSTTRGDQGLSGRGREEGGGGARHDAQDGGRARPSAVNPRAARHRRRTQVGEIVTLIGANGAGKSTLLMSLFGNRASAGRIVFDGEDITTRRRTRSPAGHRPGLARRPAHLPRMTVIENLQMGGRAAEE